MRRIILIIIIIIAVLIAAAITFFVVLSQQKPDISDYMSLIEPAISEKPDQKMLEVKFNGDPNEVLEKAYGELFSAYFRIKDAPKTNLKPPVARYKDIGNLPDDPEKMKEALKNAVWEGAVAIPVPENITVAPETNNKEYKSEIVLWKYGTVAEILHIGSYESEIPTIKKLVDFIKSSGYEINGMHEEEYLVGPGNPMTNPKDYYTIIRYQVKKVR